MVNKIILLFILYNFEVANVLLYLKKFFDDDEIKRW